ncbi:hypothetical protein EI42_06279 [Thermosporothrix hazakensis]|jgi:hypothetical protein|uniref:Uncharacterized protein n=2 Tax=Thermosporothrix TaxID=768650 RepID=A0A326TQN3_THEHA|nr:hypothetical protein EI42_06279 [Thermosporothrix hazakensis]BBH90557.1 hypothetical protein KTC_53080 [Thermosporothrix sp. COM3]GCE48610.1 hypothetical protein KTH_34790 [Thermosporothrix hazakensis]
MRKEELKKQEKDEKLRRKQPSRDPRLLPHIPTGPEFRPQWLPREEEEKQEEKKQDKRDD